MTGGGGGADHSGQLGLKPTEAFNANFAGGNSHCFN